MPPPGVRPKVRWAFRYLEHNLIRQGIEKKLVPNQPQYLKFGRKIEPPFEKDEFFTKHEKQFVTGGVYLWIAKLLHQKGPLTRREIWSIYQNAMKRGENVIPIRSKDRSRANSSKA